MPTVRRLGDGYEPHVDEIEGKLTYSLPVDSSFVSVGFSFEILQRDLDVLLADPYRRAALEVIAHTILQRSMIRGNEPVTQEAFGELVSQVLHGEPEELERFIDAIDRNHKIVIRTYVEQVLARRSAERPT